MLGRGRSGGLGAEVARRRLRGSEDGRAVAGDRGPWDGSGRPAGLAGRAEEDANGREDASVRMDERDGNLWPVGDHEDD